MVDITNGINTITVTKGAFDGIYKHQGYTLVHDYAVSSTIKSDVTNKEVAKSFIDDVTSVENQLPESEEVNESPEKSFEMANNLIEKPIGQWTKDELKAYAEENDISLDGVSSVKEVRNIIKNHIDSVK